MCFFTRACDDDEYRATTTTNIVRRRRRISCDDDPRRIHRVLHDINLVYCNNMMSDVINSARSLTVVQLKDILKMKALSTFGNKDDLIDRLVTTDPTGRWISEFREAKKNRENKDDTGSDADNDVTEDEGAGTSACGMTREFEIALYKREKELAERELAFARREIVDGVNELMIRIKSRILTAIVTVTLAILMPECDS